MTAKACTRCLVVKPLESFGNRKVARDGRHSQCLECSREANAEYRKKNRRREAERKAAYIAANPEKVRDYARSRYAANKDEFARKFKEWREGNADYRSEYTRQWRADNPGRVWENSFYERCKLKGIEPVVKPFTKEQLVERYGNKCYHCGGEFEQLDHFPVSLAKGGEHSIENTRPSCSECNKRSWRNEK